MVTPLTFTPASLGPISGVVGTAITVTLPMATGGTGPYTYIITPTLPAWLTFDAMTRMLSGTPTMAAPAATFTYTATDSATPPQPASLMFNHHRDGDTAAWRRHAEIDHGNHGRGRSRANGRR